MINYKLHTGKQTPWGYEIPATFTDSVSNKVYSKILLFPKKPEEKEIESMASFWVERIELPEEPIEEMVSKSEVEATLVELGYLTSEQKLEELTKK